MVAITSSELKTQAKAMLRLGGPLIVNNLAVAGMQLEPTLDVDAQAAGSWVLRYVWAF